MPYIPRRAVFISTTIVALAIASWGAAPRRSAGVVVDGYRIVHTYPHDDQAYTQGLIFRDGYLYESTGRYGRSTVRKVRLETGEVVQQRAVDAEYFAEGLTEWRGELLQLTWRSGLCFVYDSKTLGIRRTFSYSGEGWGLTNDGTSLILSDGSSTLRFLDPKSFREARRVVVMDGNTPITQLNELEFVRGEVLANVWHSNRIARISPADGRVVGWIDMSGLLSSPARLDGEAVLNGIAYDPAGTRLFVTGKLWPKLFEIEVVPGRSKK